MTLRKHRAAFAALAIYHFVFFFPLLFMGRVVSPNDVFRNYPPWSIASTREPVQNSLINDPPTSYYTLMSLVKSGHDAFHWNPYIAAGIPGFGSSASAVMTPFVLLPVLALPLTWVYTAIILLKLNVAFWFAYMWLREERLGKGAAAVGAIIIAASGVYAVRWLWQSTNATALYPALLWIVRRIWNRRSIRIWAVTLVMLAYALAGFPAAMAYGVYLAVAYAAFLAVRERSLPLSKIGVAAAAVVIALLIAGPALVPFVQFVQRTGYLATRAETSWRVFYPATHWRSFFQPDRLGNGAYKNWTGDPALGTLNNYVESTIYAGVVAMPLLLLALARRRGRSRWFWLVTTAVICGCMFGAGGFPQLIARLPGFKYSSLTRMSMLLPLGLGYLSAAGAGMLSRWSWRWLRPAVSVAVAVAASADLGVFAGRFHPYVPAGDAGVDATPAISFLQSQPAPFRIAPFFNYFWPNASELFRLEDVRSHFSSEETYRKLLLRIDPASFGHSSTVINFDSRSFNFSDPLVSMLGIRYFIEQPDIDIIRWTTFAKTVPGVKERGSFLLPPRWIAQRMVHVGSEPFYAIELPVSLENARPGARLIVTLLSGSQVLYTRAFLPADIDVMNKVYVPLRQYARAGSAVLLRIQPLGASASLLGGEGAAPGETPMFYGRVTTPVVFDRQLVDGRIFRNAGEVPRFRPSLRVRRMSLDQLLKTADVDFWDESVITDATASMPVTTAGAAATLQHYEPGLQQIATSSNAPFFLASSEKLTPELRVTIDGHEAGAVQINGLFAGVAVPAGRHSVRFERQLARGIWWPLAALGSMLLGLSAVLRR